MSGSNSLRPGFVTRLFLELGTRDYAIARGLDEIDTPLVSDLDVVIRMSDATEFIRLAQKEGLLAHIVKAYGGCRVFVGTGPRNVKRIDFMWRCHYRGIHLLDLRPILSNRKLHSDSGLYVLSEADHARVLFSVKNAYGGAEKYCRELSEFGLAVLKPSERWKWLTTKFLEHPVRAIIGAMHFVLTYATRLIRPSGLTVFGKPATILAESNTINYLFQDRVRQSSCVQASYHARVGSALCSVAERLCAQLDLSSCVSLSDCEQAVLAALRARCRAHDLR